MYPRGLNSVSLLLALCLFGLCLTARDATSEPVQWEVNGHWYDAIERESTWIEAYDDARSRSHQGWQGHLATLTSAAENDFVWSTFQAYGYWLGGYQVAWARQVDRGWRWATRELWRFTNWGEGEPNDGEDPEDGAENFLHFWDVEPHIGTWNDIHDRFGTCPGYVIEYEPRSYRPIRRLQRQLTTTWERLTQAP